MSFAAAGAAVTVLQAIVGGGLALGWGGVNWLLNQQSSAKGEYWARCAAGLQLHNLKVLETVLA